ncbi:30S ribosomal protein S1 [Lentilactobacillus laojiaonis]|uniref:30S ribosomal protein S1 n=1 Tax=Lentilactobacillus laojiaonis TaxID=2883998 RepID=UPI001D0B585B|nr:30S ribosomal protein S1 [Lentilactobacillus laojiaonis]UDM31598.1 30S ribosomal protein S1 [Lentilactobacillus laojiaonis]
MSENEERNELLEALNSVNEVNVGDVVNGEVLAVDDNQQLIVGIEGSGIEGVLPKREVASSQNFNEIKVGDRLELAVTSRIGSDKEGGSYLLSSKRLESRKVWEQLVSQAATEETIKVKVTQIVKGGLVVDAGVRGFIPASMISDRFVNDLNQYKGQELEVKIIEIEPANNRLILSHKAIAQKQRAESRKKVLDTIHENDVMEGKVVRLTKFGAFVDLGGIDGLVHISQISYDRVNNPADVLEVGQTVTVKVLSVDYDKERIALSIKATLPEPWDDIEDKAPVGSTLEGTVKRLTDFGAFVEVFPGVEGLVHISQISHEHVNTPGDVLKVGQRVNVKVLDVEPERHRLGLSIKALIEKTNDTENNSDDVVNEKSLEDAPEAETGFTLGDIVGNDDSDNK